MHFRYFFKNLKIKKKKEFNLKLKNYKKRKKEFCFELKKKKKRILF